MPFFDGFSVFGCQTGGGCETLPRVVHDVIGGTFSNGILVDV